MTEVAASDLVLGPLLAEGGEGRVFEVVSCPAEAQAGLVKGGGGATEKLVFKQFRRPVPLADMAAVARVPGSLVASDPGRGHRVLSCTAWPVAAVQGPRAGEAIGALMPRAPQRFWLRHRDGPLRLATLSYLTGDPDRIALAYGVTVPPPGSPARVALVYALCRAVEAWAAGDYPQDGEVVHGDLSAKNILWSSAPAPSVFILDCDGVSFGSAAPTPRRPRATTPNWDDPALDARAAPSSAIDRYALGLAFLRVLAAGNFPVQSRQRALDKVNVDLEVPRSWRHLPDMPELWRTCAASLSVVQPGARPPASVWCQQLELVLGALGRDNLAAAVREAQGDPRPSGGASGPAAQLAGQAGGDVPDVVVRPVIRHRSTSTWQLIKPVVGGPVDPLGSSYAGAGAAPGSLGAASPREFLRRTAATWGAAHRLAVRLLRSPGRRGHGLRRLSGVLALDVAAACVVLFLVGMIVSPWIGL